MKVARATLFVVGGISWIASSLVFGSLLLPYFVNGAGLQSFPFYSGTVLVGLVHVVGFVIAALSSRLCFLIGIGICAQGLVSPSPTQDKENGAKPDQFNVTFAETGRILEYSDVEGHIEFTFDVGATGKISLSAMNQPFDSARHQIAVERTTQYLQSRGFWVDMDR